MSSDPEPPEPPALSVTEAVTADQVAAHAAEGHGVHGPFHAACENCGTKLAGPFCHKCGQHDFEFHRSFWHVFLEALENFFHFDAKLFRNTLTLLFRPGRLTADFNAGKRAAQMPPLRLYIFVSILFFFVEFASPQAREGIVKTDPTDRAALREALQETRENLQQNTTTAQGWKVKKGLTDDVNHAAPKTAKPSGKNRPESKLEASLQEKWRFVYEHQHEVAEAFIHAFPKMLLFCLPFFALYTRVLFRKSGIVYLQHLVVALHFHTFIYVWVMVRNGWSGLTGFMHPGLGGLVEFGCNLWLTLYPFVMLRRLFGNSWKLTIFKTGVLTFTYSLTLTLVFAAAALIILATI